MKVYPLMLLIIFSSFKPGTEPITWADYKGTPPSNTPWVALTQTSIELTTTEADGKFTFNVTLEFDRDGSWTKTSDPKILKHETGHYDISWIVCGRIRRALLPYQYTINKKQALREYDRQVARWSWIEQLYDRETFHGRDISAQKRWEAKISRELATSYTFSDR